MSPIDVSAERVMVVLLEVANAAVAAGSLGGPVLPELDVEVLALNLQFFRLDDVVHFSPEAAEFRHPSPEMEEKFAGFYNFLAVGQNPLLR